MAKYLKRNKDETGLEKHVRCWINWNTKYCRRYADWKAVVKDLFYRGCESGIVSYLVYNWDCCKFVQRYLDDICFFISEYQEDYGCMPFSKEPFTPTLLAHQGFILAAQKIAREQGYYD